MSEQQLHRLIAAELAIPIDSRVRQAAEFIAAKHPGALAVIFYGSCLRTGEIDGQMLDFYLIVRDYAQAYDKSWMAWANRLIPPNVFPFEQRGIAAKYAVLSEADLWDFTGPGASNVSVWARFAQPVRLAWVADEAVADRLAKVIARAPKTLLSLAPAASDPVDRWRHGFELTYGAELRAERGDRPGSIVDWDVDRYRRMAQAVSIQPLYSERRWRKLRRNGKLLTILRLAKASLTFAGGVDYLAWKIRRHSGVDIVVRPWQRRWPLLGGLILLPQLLRKGAVR
jgi:hypothetical protein